MSVDWLSAAFRAEGVTTSQKVVLLALADRADEAGVSWPSYRDLQLRTALRRTAVRDALHALRDAGWLEFTARERSNGSDTSHEFRLLFDRRADPLTPPSEAYSSNTPLLFGDRGEGSRAEGGVSPRDRGRGRHAIGGVSPDDPLYEPSLEPSYEPSPELRESSGFPHRLDLARPEPRRRGRMTPRLPDDITEPAGDAPAPGAPKRRETRRDESAGRGTSGTGLAIRFAKRCLEMGMVDACNELALGKRLTDLHRRGRDWGLIAEMIDVFLSSPERYTSGDRKPWVSFLEAVPKLEADVDKGRVASGAAFAEDPYAEARAAGTFV